MAVTITETGRNSATVTYGGIATGADIWDTFRAVDKWIRNDTLSGTVTASASTVTGTNTVFLKQLTAGDQIMIGSQVRTVATVPNDTTFTVTSAFSPAITLPSSVHYIRGSLTGISAATTVRGTTNGTVATTAGSTTVTGTGTWFMSCATNSIVPILLSGTVEVSSTTDTPANTITGIGTSFATGDHTSSTRLQPGDCITVVSNGRSFYFEVDQVSSDLSVTVVSGPTTAIAAGAQIYKATNGATGRTISINGQIRQITALTSNTSLTVNAPFDFTDSGMRMKTYPRGTVANAVAGTRIQSTGCSSSGTVLTVAATLTGLVTVGSALQVTAGTGALATGVATTILNQITGGSGASVTSASCSGSSGTNTITLGATNSSIRVGQLLSGNGATIAGIEPDTYVTTISGTTVTLSKNLSGTLSGTTVHFYNPGGLGTYTLSATPGTPLSAATVTFSTIQGTNANFAWDLADGDQVWIGDELRTFKFSTSGTGITSTTTGGAVDIGYTLDYATYTGTTPIHTMRQLYQGVLLRPEESYINGTGTAFLTELRVGDELNIEGTDVIVSQILSNTRCRITTDFSHTLGTSSTIYKKLKIHGNVLEGNRDGGTTPGNKFSQATTILATTNSVYLAGTNQITVASATNFNQYNLIKIHGAGGAPVVLSGTINNVTASTTVTGTGTLFTTQLFIGAEVSIAGQYFVVTAIASDTSMTVNSAMTVVGPTPIYRTIPHYSAIASASGVAAVTLAQPIQHTVYATAANPCIVYTPNTGADFIEYVYSSPNKSAEASTALLNTSLDRKYFGFRFYPLMQNATTYSTGNVISGYTPTATATISTALSGWNTPVYERWAAGYAGTGGVGINLADCSGGTVMIGSQPTTTTFTLSNLICGSVAVPATTTQYSPFAAGVADNVVTAISGGTVNASASTYTMTLSPTIAANSVVIGGISTVFDTQIGTQTSGGSLYLFGNSRYFCLQGKSLANVPTNWIGCFEFERAQPEDLGTGIVGTTGVTISSFNLAGGVAAGSTFLTEPAKNQGMGASAVLYASGATPYPCYGYINGQRMPVGASQYPSLPGPGNAPVHGNVISVPRVRSSPTDLVGVNAHIYSALTITLGRWGHMYDLSATGAYISPGTIASNGLPVQTTTAPATATVDSIPQPHLGQIVPVNTNLYGGKRFMFSPIVVLGNAVDPDIRGRIYGLKIVSSNLGTLMDTVSINIDSNQFYDAGGTTTDHWLLTAAARTFRYTLRSRTDTTDPRQSYRSLEDTAAQTANTIATAFANNFRVALAV
jgi:hypothetical protein